jgi:hypothetical protein
MSVQLLYLDGCPNAATAQERLEAAIRGVGTGISIGKVLIKHRADAERYGFTGSPTILVNGSDPFAPAGAPVALTCRVYSSEDGPSGSPTAARLIEALREKTTPG